MTTTITAAPQRHTPSRLGDRITAVGIFSAAFVVRWLTLQFDNDYFMHLAWAAQMLGGERPVRDFVEPGFILQTLLSYFAFALGGQQLVWEGVIVCSFIAAGAALTYVACRLCGVGPVLAITAAVFALLVYPRAYAYPKAFLYPAALWAIAVHAQRPSRRTLTLLGAVTAMACLFRPDHGMWIGTAVAVAVVLAYWPDWKRTVGAAAFSGAVAALLVAPWALWVAASGHSLEYADNLLAGQSAVGGHWYIPRERFAIDTSAPLATMAPIAYPRVAIRWSAATSVAERQQKEQRYGLLPIGSNGRYFLRTLDRRNIHALLSDDAVEDTNDIDRGEQCVRGGMVTRAYVEAQTWLPLLRVSVLPGVISAANAFPFAVWLTFVLPWCVLAASIALRRTAVLLPAAILGIVAFQGLVRGSPDSRLGDVAGITGFLLAGIASMLWAVRGRWRIPARATVAIALMLSVSAAAAFGRTYGRLGDVDLPTLAELSPRTAATRQTYAAAPLDIYAGRRAAGLDRVARWLHECTATTSRVGVIGFEPQVFVIAERRFAGGLAFMYEGFSNSDRNQRLAVERWSRQDVPVVVAVASQLPAFSADYPIVSRWVDAHYRTERQSSFGGNKDIVVFVSETASRTGIHAPTGLPCFR